MDTLLLGCRSAGDLRAAGSVRQAAENTLHAARRQVVGIERFAAQVEASGQAGMQFGEARRIALARSHGRDLDGWVP